jgi:predicted transcriptional regulator
VATENSTSKVPLTIRTHPDNLDRLRELAKAQKTTTSALVDGAIETLLAGEAVADDGIYFTKEDIEHFLPVIEAIGKPVPLSLFLKIISTQKGA